MREKRTCCQKPEHLKDKPRDCSPEQIKECHGETKAHPCAKPKKTRRQNMKK